MPQQKSSEVEGFSAWKKYTEVEGFSAWDRYTSGSDNETKPISRRTSKSIQGAINSSSRRPTSQAQSSQRWAGFEISDFAAILARSWGNSCYDNWILGFVFEVSIIIGPPFDFTTSHRLLDFETWSLGTAVSLLDLYGLLDESTCAWHIGWWKVVMRRFTSKLPRTAMEALS